MGVELSTKLGCVGLTSSRTASSLLETAVRKIVSRSGTSTGALLAVLNWGIRRLTLCESPTLPSSKVVSAHIDEGIEAVSACAAAVGWPPG